jgi:hypothetical protein
MHANVYVSAKYDIVYSIKVRPNELAYDFCYFRPSDQKMVYFAKMGISVPSFFSRLSSLFEDLRYPD